VTENEDRLATHGLHVSASGLISGTPVLISNPELIHHISARFRVTDSDSPPTSVIQRLDIRVYPLGFRITTATLPAGVAGQPYFAFLSTAGGTAPYRFSKGSKFPRGLNLERSGAISGVPKFGGTYLVAVNAEDSRSQPQLTQKTLSLTIAGPPGPGSGGGGSRPTISATGDVRCTGRVKFKVAMSGTGASFSGAGIYKGKLACAGTTGNSLVRVTGAKVAGGFSHSGSCTVVGTHATGSRTLLGPIAIAWTAKGGQIQPSFASFNSLVASAFGLRMPMTSPLGTSNVTGSYAGFDTASGVLLTQLVTAMENQCALGGSTKTKAGGTLTITL
jgi:hypothetical protein